jgi:hypothetical protein
MNAKRTAATNSWPVMYFCFQRLNLTYYDLISIVAEPLNTKTHKTARTSVVTIKQLKVAASPTSIVAKFYIQLG